MDIDEDDDFYAPDEPEVQPAAAPAAPAPTAPKAEAQNAELEEGEEEDSGGEMDEDDDDDSDIEIVTERKDGTKAAPPSQTKYSDIRNIPQRSTSHDAAVKSTPAVKKEATPKQQHQPSISGADLPPVSNSKVDINAIPVHKATNKPITQVNIDEDLTENDKPWRRPGTDLSDYFNYGFDEFTWSMYAQKQEQLRNEYNSDAMGSGKIFEDMMSKMMMMSGGMMPGMPGGNPAAAAVPTAPTAPAAVAGGGMSGMDGGMPPEMQAAMMQQMMASGIDPSQMDPNAMMAMMQGGGGGAQGGQGQGQGFGQGYGGGQQQYGYDQQQQQQQQQQQMGRGNFGGRGRGGRRQW